MTQNDFIILCNLYTIGPAIALENEHIREALKSHNNAEVERVLREEF